MTRVLLLQLIAALAFVLAVAGPEVAMTFEPPQALSDARLTGGELAPRPASITTRPERPRPREPAARR